MPADRRPVRDAGRAPRYSYHTYRSSEQHAIGRRLFPTDVAGVIVQKGTRTISYWLSRFGALAVVVVTVAATANILVLTPDPTILPAGGSGGDTAFLHDMTAYQAAATKLFSASLLARTKLTVDTHSIESSLQKQFPELAIVSIRLPFFGHRPIISLVAQTPLFILQTLAGKSYIVGENGVALGDANGRSAQQMTLIHLADNSTSPISIGSAAVSVETASFIRDVIFQFSQKDLTIATLVLPAGRNELDAYIGGQGYYVKFNLAGDAPLNQIGTFLAVRHNLQGQGIIPGHYIDVRVEGRAYYQ